jgi:hypothetical protein
VTGFLVPVCSNLKGIYMSSATSVRSLLASLSITSFLFLSNPVHAAPIAWVDWTAFTAGFTDGTATGTAAAGGGGLTVSYSGEVYNLQTQVNGTGTDWWDPGTTWADGSIIGNAPPGSDIIALRGGTGSTNVITFSQPVTNPVMAVFSMGSPIVTSPAVTYNFDAPFDIIVGGASTAYGGSSIVELPGNVLEGVEGNGTIQFQGTFTSISFTVPTIESWHGFTIGAPAAVPIPPAVWLYGSGLLGLAGIARRRKAA